MPSLHKPKTLPRPATLRRPKLQEASQADVPLYRAIYETLLEEIQSGLYPLGARLPSEALLCKRFHASRITVAKAFQSLEREHLVVRRPGSGTYVQQPVQSAALQFGLLIPDLGTTEIFEPICQGIMRSPAASTHSLTWGSTTGASPHDDSSAEATERLCAQYIAQRVDGVFFAPTEHTTSNDEVNQRIGSMLEQSGIPVVLLDRCLERYPDRSNFDLVGIDNHRAGYLLTRHLVRAGAKRIVFAIRPHAAPTVDARISGYKNALSDLLEGAKATVISGDFGDAEYVQTMLDEFHPDGIICANDITAARLMQTLISLGVRVPADVRMVGIDDVSYAKYLPTPLTTLRQDCAEIGAVAMATMLERIAHPNQPVREVLVRCDLIVRASCGSTQVPEEQENTQLV
jgi:GntR family transcriptional regulator of arabinose operon